MGSFRPDPKGRYSTQAERFVLFEHLYYDVGFSLREIANAYAISYERVRTILDPSKRTAAEARAARRWRRLRAVEVHRAEVNQRWEAGKGAEQIARETGLSEGQVRSLVPKHDSARRRAARGRRIRKWGGLRYSDEDLLAGMKRAARSAETLGSARYARYRMEEEPDLATPLVIIKRFGSWNEAVERIGLRANVRPDWLGKRTFSTEEMLGHIRRVADEIGHPPSVSEYNAHREDGPAVPTIRVRFDTYGEALMEALGE